MRELYAYSSFMRVINILFFFPFSNMETIIEPNDLFDFSTITLAHPVGIQGGAYFTKIECNKKPLYIQTSKSLTRQGFVKTGKKYYCDLMFDKDSETIIHWLETIEEKCKKLIYDKKDAWFQGNLEENDIENAFNPLIRVYKSGKYYLLRVNIKNSKDDTPSVKIYNENEMSVPYTDITPEVEMMSILEIQGIKFTSRNFQIEIELKQMMVLQNEPIFDNCLFKTNKPVKETKEFIKHEFDRDDGIKPNMEVEDVVLDKKEDNSLEELDPLDFLEPSVNKNDVNAIKTDTNVDNKDTLNEQDLNSVNIEFEELIEENPDLLREINNDDIPLENDESITLKKPNQVYFELYKEARAKAKQAKKNAILAYLEAKNIKKTYLIENMDDSDSDFDAEIDEISESELEGL